MLAFFSPTGAIRKGRPFKKVGTMASANKNLDYMIIKWHKQTFPDCTYESQLLKLEEELEEYKEARKPYKITELADIYIVSLVLMDRFESLIGSHIFEWADKIFKIIGYDAVKEKFEANKDRVWIIDRGVYRHKIE